MQLVWRYGRCSGIWGQEIQFKILLLSLHPASAYLHPDKALCGQSNKMYSLRHATSTLYQTCSDTAQELRGYWHMKRRPSHLRLQSEKCGWGKHGFLSLKIATVHSHAVISPNKQTLIGVKCCCYNKCVCSKQHKQDWQYTYNVTLRRVGATIVAVDKQ